MLRSGDGNQAKRRTAGSIHRFSQTSRPVVMRTDALMEQHQDN